MIEINLIPDVKRELLRAQALRNFIIFISTVVAAGSIALIVLILGTIGAQNLLMGAKDSEIKNSFSEISKIPDVNKTTTLQNQLSEIYNLRKASPNVSRILTKIIAAINTTGVYDMAYSSISYDPESKQVIIEAQSRNKGTPEAFKKTINETEIFFREDDKNDACSYEQASNNENGCVIEKLVGSEEARESELTGGEDEEGREITRFKVAFKINPKALKFTSRYFEVKSPSKKDATDSTTQIPDGIFQARAKNKGEE